MAEKICSACAPLLRIRMLGGFSIEYGSNTVTEAGGRAKKLWWLLEYLIANRKRGISQEALIDLLWSGEDSDHPMNSLKNLIYRARGLLKTLDAEKEFIRFDRGTYTWNPDYPCVVDVEEFERLFRRGERGDLPEVERLEAYKAALDLYQGEFLPKSSYLDWVIAKNAYYQSLYLQCNLRFIRLLEQHGDTYSVIRVCEQVISLCPYEEPVHQALLRAYAETGQQKKALEHYGYLSDQFYNEFGVGLQPETVGIYREIIKSMCNPERNLDVIKEELEETCAQEGAFFCEYEVFRQIYRLQARAMLRNDCAIFIALVTVTDAKGEAPPLKQIKEVLPGLAESICAGLRRGDVVARYSATQLVLMLPLTTYENGQRVLRRILKKHEKGGCMEGLNVSTRLRAIDPVEVE